MPPENLKLGSKIVGIMFLDIKNFSKLTQSQLEVFITSVLPSIAEVIDPYRNSLLELNTWGDAIIAISDNPVVIARLSLGIRDYFRSTNFEAKGMPQVMQSRISLHVGTVAHAYDPIRKCEGVIGTNLNLAARIEPIVVPGEVWATMDFFNILKPSISAEQLAFDNIGEQELAKDYGICTLYRLRRSAESSALSEVATSTLESKKTRSKFQESFDVIGLGALNTDFIATAESLKKINPSLITEHESYFELGYERPATVQEVKDLIQEIGSSILTPILGGSSFNTIHALACAVPQLRLGYIGVAGQSNAAPGFIEKLRSLGIDHSLIKKSSNESGICVSYPSRGERSIIAAPGANTEIAYHLRDNRKAIVSALGRTRLVHVTSLFDPESPELVASILSEAKEQNPWLQISFDPGHDWSRRIQSGDEVICRIMRMSSYLFLNDAEFRMLSSDTDLINDRNLAQDIFKNLSPQTVLILIKRYNEVLVYHKLHQQIKEIRFPTSSVALSEIEDTTGAGDTFAAGLLLAITIPGLELRDGVEIGLQMVRSKLLTAGSNNHALFHRIVEEHVDRVYGI
jgi:sugar/nucleoside kinase (ribokinase family)/class 3 adenylate cyclase